MTNKQQQGRRGEIWGINPFQHTGADRGLKAKGEARTL